MDKKYYTLEEAGGLLGGQASDVLYLGANEQLPIYVLAADWPVNVHIRYGTEEPNPYSSVPSNEWLPSIEWPQAKTAF